MATTYTPRRESKAWLDGDCPREVLFIRDNGGETFDRYTVVYNDVTTPEGYSAPWLWYRGMSEHPTSAQGFGIADEMSVWDARDYRERTRRTERCKWSDLPADVKACVIADCEAIRESRNTVQAVPQ